MGWIKKAAVSYSKKVKPFKEELRAEEPQQEHVPDLVDLFKRPLPISSINEPSTQQEMQLAALGQEDMLSD